MIEATIEDLALPSWSSKEPDEVRRRGCIEHSFGKEVRSGLNRGHPFSRSRANVRSSAADEKGGEGMVKWGRFYFLKSKATQHETISEIKKIEPSPI